MNKNKGFPGNTQMARAALALVAVTAAVFFAGCAKKAATASTTATKAPEPEPLHLGVMTDTITDYAATIGLAEGIFEKHGLKVDVATFAAGINTIDAVTTGQMDIGFGADFAVINRLGGSPTTPLQVFTGLGEGASDSWHLYARGKDINTIGDLAGKQVVTRLGTVEEYWWVRTLELSGLDTAQVKFLPVEATMEGVALIQKGSAVAMWASARPAQSLNALPDTHPIADLSAAGAPTLSVTVATKQFLGEHQSTVVKYLQAMQELYDFISSDPQRAAEIVNKVSSVPVEQVLVNIKSQVNYIKFDQQIFDGLNNLRAWAEDRGIVKYPYDLQKYVNVDALNAAFPGRGQFN